MNSATDTSGRPIDDPAQGFERWEVAPPKDLERVVSRYPFRVTPHLLSHLDPGQPNDPLALQCMPRAEELIETTDPDPIGDAHCRPAPRLVRKHENRVVLLATNSCLMTCRFCFRKAGVFSGPDRDGGLEAAFRYIEGDSTIREVILSGGDPLALSDQGLDRILSRLRAIPHVRLLRIHTRALTAQPARITPSLVARLQQHRPLYLVLHTNHARELGPEARSAIERLLEARIPLLNQSVLLRGINDDPDTLAALSWRLLEMGVSPYYLHHCDRVPGTSHFWVSLEAGRALHAQLATRVPGHGLPRYVIDLPGGAGKVPVMAGQNIGPGRWLFPAQDGSSVLVEELPLEAVGRPASLR